MTRDELRDQMAEVIRDYHYDLSVNDLPNDILARLDALGLAVVSREATEAMQRKGAAAMWDATERGRIIGYDPAAAVWSAMVRAATEPPAAGREESGDG